MASRAHFIHDYPLSAPRPRERGQVWSRNDPVVLPRSSVWSAGGGLIAAALSIGAIVAASAYGAFHSAPPALADTPTAPLIDRWKLDSLVQEAHVTSLLSGPARAVPNRGTPAGAGAFDDEPFMSTPPSEAVMDDSTPGERLPGKAADQPLQPSTSGVTDQSLAPSTPGAADAAPYPNPTTTPPDAIAPPSTAPQTPTPVLNPENPYRD